MLRAACRKAAPAPGIRSNTQKPSSPLCDCSRRHRLWRAPSGRPPVSAIPASSEAGQSELGRCGGCAAHGAGAGVGTSAASRAVSHTDVRAAKPTVKRPAHLISASPMCAHGAVHCAGRHRYRWCALARATIPGRRAGTRRRGRRGALEQARNATRAPASARARQHQQGTHIEPIGLHPDPARGRAGDGAPGWRGCVHAAPDHTCALRRRIKGRARRTGRGAEDCAARQQLGRFAAGDGCRPPQARVEAQVVACSRPQPPPGPGARLTNGRRAGFRGTASAPKRGRLHGLRPFMRYKVHR